MASKSSALGALSYETETNFGETTTTTATRLRPIGPISWDLQHPGQKVDILKNYPNEGVQMTRMPMGGTVSFTLNLTGLGGTAASAPPASALAALLGTVFGATAAGLSTGTTASAGTTTITTAAASGITRGAPVHIGVKGDGRGDGQWVVGTHAASTLTSLVALPAAASGTDPVYCSRVVYGSQTAGTYETLSSVRLRVQTARQNYLCHGCYPTAAEFSINPGEVPTIRLTYAVSWWEPVSGTLPSATAVEDFGAAPIAGGSMFLNVVGTATRSTVVARQVSFTIALNNQGEVGTGGYDEHQSIVGCNRGPTTLGLEMVIDAEAAGTDTYGALWDISENSRLKHHAMYSMSVIDGRALAFYWPNMVPIEARPVQFDDSGVLRMRLKFEPTTGPDTTSDLTLSPWRLAMA